MKDPILLAALLAPACLRLSARSKGGIEEKDYKWNAQGRRKGRALHQEGRRQANGKEAYEVCGACHLPSGASRPTAPSPARRQHTTVLIKQMADIRAGLRDNPTMYPFRHLTDPQELADVAVYIKACASPSSTANYEGPDAAIQVARARNSTKSSVSMPRQERRR